MRVLHWVVLVSSVGCGSTRSSEDAHADITVLDSSGDRADPMDAAGGFDATPPADDSVDAVVLDSSPDASPCAAPGAMDVPSVRDLVVTLAHGTEYTPLSATQFADAREAAAALGNRDLAMARTSASRAEYGVTAFRSRQSGACYWLVAPNATAPVGQGSLIVTVDAARRDLVIEAPHIPYDRHTDEEAAIVFERVGARALVIAGAQRCASTTLSGCRSNTECSPDGAVESDVAHSVDSAFHAFHRGIASDAGRVAIQFHTNLSPATNGDALVSNGTRVESTNTMTTRFFDALVTATTGMPGCLDDATSTSASQAIRIRGCNIAGMTFTGTPLCGVTNTQALASNLATDDCGGSVSTATDRFIHVEQCSRQLDDVTGWSGHVASAIEAVW